MKKETITPEELFRKMKAHEVLIIDVRTPGEYASIHIEGAELLPLDMLEAKNFVEKITSTYKTPPTIYITCAFDTRSKVACDRLQAAGYENVVVLEGGTNSWAAAGLPVVRASQPLPLPQQVQIFIGSFILLGMFLGTYVAHEFYIIPFFSGVGLIYNGISGNCYALKLLSKMPWNKEG